MDIFLVIGKELFVCTLCWEFAILEEEKGVDFKRLPDGIKFKNSFCDTLQFRERLRIYCLHSHQLAFGSNSVLGGGVSAFLSCGSFAIVTSNLFLNLYACAIIYVKLS